MDFDENDLLKLNKLKDRLNREDNNTKRLFIKIVDGLSEGLYFDEAFLGPALSTEIEKNSSVNLILKLKTFKQMLKSAGIIKSYSASSDKTQTFMLPKSSENQFKSFVSSIENKSKHL